MTKKHYTDFLLHVKKHYPMIDTSIKGSNTLNWLIFFHPELAEEYHVTPPKKCQGIGSFGCRNEATTVVTDMGSVLHGNPSCPIHSGANIKSK